MGRILTPPVKKMNDSLTDRQRRELEYHKAHAVSVKQETQTISYEPVTSPVRRWWNAYWDSWTFLTGLQLRGQKVLVVGCGAGSDALLFAKLGAIVSAFDLSPDMLAHGIRLAKQDGLSVAFAEMPAENMQYPAGTFDIVFCRDILHHVDIPATMKEIVRVAKPGALMFVNEIYSHSITNLIRRSRLVEKTLYPLMQRFIYKGQKPYITEDERKMTEMDVAQVKSHLGTLQYRKYFNFLVTRVVPDRFRNLNKLDRIALRLLGPLGYFCAGRIVFVGRLPERAN
jgi:ubiquinone/menaquinone biosynthesis C-methylase UbiE